MLRDRVVTSVSVAIVCRLSERTVGIRPRRSEQVCLSGTTTLVWLVDQLPVRVVAQAASSSARERASLSAGQCDRVDEVVVVRVVF